MPLCSSSLNPFDTLVRSAAFCSVIKLQSQQGCKCLSKVKCLRCYKHENHDNLWLKVSFQLSQRESGFWRRRIRAECKSVFEARPEAKCEIPSVEDKSPPSCPKHALKWPAGGWRRQADGHVDVELRQSRNNSTRSFGCVSISESLHAKLCLHTPCSTRSSTFLLFYQLFTLSLLSSQFLPSLHDPHLSCLSLSTLGHSVQIY